MTRFDVTGLVAGRPSGPVQTTAGGYLFILSWSFPTYSYGVASIYVYKGGAEVFKSGFLAADSSNPANSSPPSGYIGGTPSDLHLDYNYNGVTVTVTGAVVDETLAAQDINDNSAGLAAATGLPVSFFSAHADRIASDLMGVGITYSMLQSDPGKVVSALQAIVPPSAALIRDRLAAPISLGLGVPLNVVLAASDAIESFCMSAYLPAGQVTTPTGLQVCAQGVSTFPPQLRPPASTITRDVGCRALGYVWDGGVCHAADSGAFKSEAIASQAVGQPGPVVSDAIVAPPTTLTQASTAVPPPSFPLAPIALLGGGAVVLYLLFRGKH